MPSQLITRVTGGVRRAIVRASSAALDVLFPPQCAFCHADLPERRPSATSGPGTQGNSQIASICATCRPQLARPRPTSCAKCGAALAPAAAVMPDCPRCRDRKFGFQSVIYLGTYERELQEAVLRTKHARQEVLVDALTDLLWEERGGEICAFAPEAIAPVPMHWRRRWWRGMNSAERVGQRLGRYLRVPSLPLLKRTRATVSQGGLDRQERFSNLRKAFAMRSAWKCDGARVLLVDDIMTTGATCGECTKVLLADTAAAVMVAVIARAEGPGG